MDSNVKILMGLIFGSWTHGPAGDFVGVMRSPASTASPHPSTEEAGPWPGPGPVHRVAANTSPKNAPKEKNLHLLLF